MATAYEVMAKAKAKGARVRAEEAYDKFMHDWTNEQRRAEKAMARGKFGGSLGSALSSLVMPSILGSLGLATGGLGSVALGSLVGALGTGGAISIGDMLAGGGGKRGKTMAGNIKMRDYLKDVSPYGRAYARERFKPSEFDYSKAVQNTKDLVDMLGQSRFGESILSGIISAGKTAKTAKDVRKGTYKGTEIGPPDARQSIEPTPYKMQPAFGKGTLNFPLGERIPSEVTGFKDFWGGGYEQLLEMARKNPSFSADKDLEEQSAWDKLIENLFGTGASALNIMSGSK